jgi:PTH1 family peptidyl-tRNA hydrolase
MSVLIVGLGNIGEKYVDTRHNIGFSVVEAIARRKSASFEPARFGDLARFQASGQIVYLLKPNTFMNLSGDAVRFWLKQSQSEISNLLVVTDDISIDFGRIRIRPKGSAGGHNGLTDIELKIVTQSYARLRMGIGSDFEKGKQADFVLGKFNEEEMKGKQLWLDKAVDACLCFCTRGLDVAMNQFNS